MKKRFRIWESSKRAGSGVPHALLLAAAVLGCGIACHKNESVPLKPQLVIATGRQYRDFDLIGQALAQVYAKEIAEMNFSTVSTGGSVFNVRALQNGQVQMAFAQSDVAYFAFKQGTAKGTGSYRQRHDGRRRSGERDCATPSRRSRCRFRGHELSWSRDCSTEFGCRHQAARDRTGGCRTDSRAASILPTDGDSRTHLRRSAQQRQDTRRGQPPVVPRGFTRRVGVSAYPCVYRIACDAVATASSHRVDRRGAGAPNCNTASSRGGVVLSRA